MSNIMMSIEQQRLWTAASGGHCHTYSRDLNVAPEKWLSRSCRLVTGSCLPAKLHTWDRLHSERKREALLWRESFLDTTSGLVNRHVKTISRSADFTHTGSKEPFWLDSSFKPARVDAQLTLLDKQMRGPARPTSNPTCLPNGPGPPLVPRCEGKVTAQTVIKLCEKGQLTEAVDALSVLVQTESRISTSLLYNVLKRCAAERNLALGRRVHDLTVKLGYESNAFLGNHILRMYASQGRLQEAMDVLNRVAIPNAFMWFSIISAYAKQGKPKEAIQLYHKMRSSGVKPDSHVIAAGLQACASALDLESGRQVHTDLLKSGVSPDPFVCSCLVDMYAKCGKLEDARKAFDSFTTRNVVTWTAMIAGYAEHGLGQEALALYARMECEGLILANGVTFACLLKACASAGALQQGKQLHSQIVERGLLEGDLVLGSCLVDMYAKCGKLEDARRLFDSMPRKDVITWTAMIAGYAEHGCGQDALALYAKMEQKGSILANDVTLSCLLKACASSGALQQGKQLHSQIVERGLVDCDFGSCLVEMYAKCGRLEDACRVFDGLSTRDVVTWTVMIHGFGQNNEGRKAIRCFEEMLLAGVQPDETTFTCLLVACSHEGLVNEGRHYFYTMAERHGIKPTVKHYSCMVELLGRAGHLDEAENMMQSFESNNVGWMSLLNASRIHRDIDRGTRCFESLVRLDPQNASAYVLMAGMYAAAGRWTDVGRIESLRKSAGAGKKPAMAGIEVDRSVRTFVVGVERDEISCKARSINARLKEEGGHVPHTQLVLKPLSEKEKEDELCGHAEKLALAYGLLNTPNGTPLLVTKNLRMCMDCHSSTEIMSRIERREIVVRDAYCVHRFTAGSCSCGGRP